MSVNYESVFVPDLWQVIPASAALQQQAAFALSAPSIHHMTISPRMPIVDTHQHLWDPALFSYSWMKDYPRINQKHLVGEYRLATHGTEVTGSVYVDTDVDYFHLAAETRFILALAAEPDHGILGVVAGAKLERPDFREYIAEFLCHPQLKGVRRVLHNQPDDTAEKPQFVENVRLLGDWGLSFDLCVNWRQLPAATNLVRECPEVSFVLDHCGGPAVKARALYPWRKYLHAISREPNVTCKLSGLLSDPAVAGWTSADLRPYVSHAIDCFGWERIMWGSDWPVCGSSNSLIRWLNMVKHIVHPADLRHQEALFFRNAQRIYRLTDVPCARDSHPGPKISAQFR